MYYIFEFKMPEGGYFAERMKVLENGKEFDQSVLSLLTDGVSLKSRNIEITYPKTRGKVGHVLEGVFGFPTVSNVILDVLRDFCQEDIDLEITPVTIKRKSPFEYFFINILHKVDAIDDQQSELVELIPGIKVYDKIDRLVLNPQQIGDRSMFRVHGGCTWIFITEPLKQALEALALEELDFIPIDETFKWSMSSGIEGRNWWD